MKRAVALLALLFSFPLAAQTQQTVNPLLRNVSGTASNPGDGGPRLFSDGAWKAFIDSAAFVTYVSESGPAEQRNEVFSTNFLTIGLGRDLFGDRATLLFRGRVSLEPYTVPDEGYPQVLQYVSPEAGGPLLDFMRPHDLIGEAAVHLGVRTTQASWLHLYAAPIGEPAFGAVPFAQRSSSIDFAEAPYGYEIHESVQDATSVVTLGWTSSFISLEGSVFHDAVTFDDHTDIDTDGDIDSRSARLTLTPTRNISLQVSRAELGEDDNEREATSASISWGSPAIAATALWTRRDGDGTLIPDYEAIGAELALRGGRNTFMLRGELVDRPANLFGDTGAEGPTEESTHITIGYIYDFIARPAWRGGLGVNIDYHTNTHELEELPQYGHKPQGIYAFIRFRTGRN
ncbi:MAG TPA: hypothetical protein VGF69_08515 [Thermoanaerobaculia bacterium]|jgi:hypothetical protein